jgi:hypothetical protein
VNARTANALRVFGGLLGVGLIIIVAGTYVFAAKLPG